MSIFKKQSIVCPGCEERSDVGIWDSLNVTIDTDMYEAVRDGSVFAYECPKCGFKSRFVYPMLYHDMDKKQMIYLCTDSNTAKSAAKEFDDMLSGKQLSHIKEKTGVEPPDNTADMKDYTLRIVPTYDKLKEKLFIFDAGLDDRAVEIYKSIVYKMLSEQGHDLERISFFYTKERGDAKSGEIQFFRREEGSGFSEFNPEMYEEIAEFTAKTETCGEYVIDEAWADKITEV